MLRVGLLVLGLVGLVLWGQLQAAPRAPRKLKPGQSCANANCHQEQTKLRFPHTSPNKQICQDCHKPITPTRHRFRPARKDQKACVGCHKEYQKTHARRKSWRFVHGPVVVGDCLSCHAPHGSNHRHLLRRAATQICTTCHSDLGHSNSADIHRPVQDGECLSCHVSHGSSSRYLLRDDLAKQCLSCHKPIKQQLAQVRVHHGAVVRGQQCLNCHAGHEKRHKHMLKRPNARLCLGCHDQEVVLQGKQRLVNIKKHLQEHKVHHEPIRKGQCTPCHKAHGSQFTRLLPKTFPPKLYAAFSASKYALCFSCHNPKLVTARQTYRDTRFRNGALNLHYVHVQGKKGRSCRFCHDPHATHKPHLMRKKTQFGRWEMPVGYQKQAGGGMCQGACHEPKRYRRKRPVKQGYHKYKKFLAAPALLQERRKRSNSNNP